ncbi:hypothetical protein PPL_00775 [Heterostelium album PN500]|uniref:Uncharacterized protein n=1 Tax=Heterostelium pallidum (strain ATCC 26659 / Pp 5 / PN500) TaxID=670386 RepID=D3AXE4_HETP5|nr:hypothetical protein PPL_00775 [Heterostelium album PN500]EFA86213.1 hypothetical protein PPL_00775 [Heterostelium album PN500]|eukprot:XP_020438318.1 hypothetical protein PPL_00775 [Heterostelium album PN500]
MADPNAQSSDTTTTTTTTTTSNSTASTDPTTTTNDLRIRDLENNNNDDQNQSTPTLFPDVTPTSARPDPLSTYLFKSSLAASKLPISSTIVPGQPDKKVIKNLLQKN